MPDAAATSVTRSGPGGFSPAAAVGDRPRPRRSEAGSGPRVGEDGPAEDSAPARNGIARRVPPEGESPSGPAAGRPGSAPQPPSATAQLRDHTRPIRGMTTRRGHDAGVGFVPRIDAASDWAPLLTFHPGFVESSQPATPSDR